MKISDANALFESEVFANWTKGREQKAKMILSTIERIDGVIKAIYAVAKRRRQ